MRNGSGRLCAAAAVVVLAAGLLAHAQQERDVPLGTGPDGVDGLTLAASAGTGATLSRVADADAGKAAWRLTLKKTGDERRLVALAAPLKESLDGMRALHMRLRHALGGEAVVRPAVLVLEEGGAVWYRVGADAVPAGDAFSEVRVNLKSLAPAAFSTRTDGAPEWAKVNRVWVGMVVDGACSGDAEISRAFLTSRPYRPATAFPLWADGPGTWTVGKDPAVEVKLSTDQAGPDGKAMLRYEFTFPGARHMYLVPSRSLPAVELDAYLGVKLTYRAALPTGIKGLLFMLGEGGNGQYCAEPPPPATGGEWKTLVVPFSSFKLGDWSKDENGQLDLAQVRTIMVGVHGVATEGGSGTVEVGGLEFVPVLP